MAGVRGPCPICSSLIEAPQPPLSAAAPPPAAAPPYQTPHHPQAPPYQVPTPQASPQPPPPYQEPVAQLPSPGMAASASSSKLAATIPPPRIPQPSGPTIVKVEPKPTRTRSQEPPEVIGRPISEEHLADYPHARGEYRPSSSRRNITPRLLICAATLLIMVGVSVGLMRLTREPAEATPAFNTPSIQSAAVPAEDTPPANASGDPAPAPEAVVAEPAKPPTPPAPVEPAAPPPGAVALQTVEKFLAASSLQERLPFIETSTPTDALEESILAKPFPPDPQVAPEFQERNEEDGYTDFYYNVDFTDAAGKASPQILLVRYKDGDSPKVIVDPFLDTFGGRLAAFAATPSDETVTFQLVVSAVAQTTADRNIPNHENKLRLKLMPRDNEKEITSAYFTKLSKLGQMLITDGSGFRYGQPRAARVTLRWNQEEAPDNPFLEVTDIKEFRWNP